MKLRDQLRLIFGVSRCVYCGHFIWPTNRIGWYVWSDDGGVDVWHPSCRRAWWLANHPEDWGKYAEDA